MLRRTFSLSNGVRIPAIGLGTYKITTKEEIERAVESALSSGYRHIDTASGYRNEHFIGDCLESLLPKLGLARSDIFLTSKIGPRFQGDRSAIVACVEKSLAQLKTNYLDLCLIHWPGTQKLDVSDPLNQSNRLVTWKTLVELHEKGQVRSIGVSNYSIKHLSELEETGTLPHVNQVELHPHFPQDELIAYCRSKDILIEAYSSLGTSASCNPLISDETLLKVSRKTSVSPAQLLLFWGLSKGAVILPKSTNADHIRQNIEVLNLTLKSEDLEELDAISIRKKYAWNPENII